MTADLRSRFAELERMERRGLLSASMWLGASRVVALVMAFSSVVFAVLALWLLALVGVFSTAIAISIYWSESVETWRSFQVRTAKLKDETRDLGIDL